MGLALDSVPSTSTDSTAVDLERQRVEAERAPPASAPVDRVEPLRPNRFRDQCFAIGPLPGDSLLPERLAVPEILRDPMPAIRTPPARAIPIERLEEAAAERRESLELATSNVIGALAYNAAQVYFADPKTQLAAGRMGLLFGEALNAPGLHELSRSPELEPAVLWPLSPEREAAAQQAARSAAGTHTREAMKSARFATEDPTQVEALAKGAAKADAHNAYAGTLRETGDPKLANEEALKSAKITAREIVAERSELDVQATVERGIQDGSAFNGALEPAARARLEAYLRGEGGQVARSLAPKLDGLGPRAFLARMDAEVAAGRATTKQVQRKDQVMTVWEFPDGTTIRYKPEGDAYRSGPSYSVGVKIDPAAPDQDLGSEAFKVDQMGRPVPKSLEYAMNPYPPDSRGSELWSIGIMGAGHRNLSEDGAP